MNNATVDIVSSIKLEIEEETECPSKSQQSHNDTRPIFCKKKASSCLISPDVTVKSEIKDEIEINEDWVEPNSENITFSSLVSDVQTLTNQEFVTNVKVEDTGELIEPPDGSENCLSIEERLASVVSSVAPTVYRTGIKSAVHPAVSQIVCDISSDPTVCDVQSVQRTPPQINSSSCSNAKSALHDKPNVVSSAAAKHKLSGSKSHVSNKKVKPVNVEKTFRYLSEDFLDAEKEHLTARQRYAAAMNSIASSIEKQADALSKVTDALTMMADASTRIASALHTRSDCQLQ